MPNLPVNIDASYADDPNDPSRQVHQGHHDVIHETVNRIPDDGAAVLTKTTGNAAYVGLTGAQTVAGNKTFSGTTDLATADVDSLRVKGPWFDVKHPDFGATGDGVTNDRAAIQAAIDAAAAAGGGTVFFPSGTYLCTTALTITTSGVNLVGPSRESTIIRNATTAVLQLGGATTLAHFVISGVTLKSAPGGGHVIQQLGNVSQSCIRDARLDQDNAGMSAWEGGTYQYIDMLVLNVTVDHVNGSTVPTWNLPGANINRNTWQQMRFTFASNYSIKLDSPSTTAPNFDNVFRDINFEVTNGGCIYLGGCYTSHLENLAVYDLSTATTRHLFAITAGAGGLASHGSYLNQVVRRGGTLGTGLYDISFDTNAAGSAIVMACHGSSGGTGFKVDLALGSAMVFHTLGFATFDRNTSSTIIDTAGSILPARGFQVRDVNLYRSAANVWTTDDKLQVALELEVDGPLNHDGTTVGFYGAAPVAKAGNPGTATGTDAAVINAIVTALRNLGLVT